MEGINQKKLNIQSSNKYAPKKYTHEPKKASLNAYFVKDTTEVEDATLSNSSFD